jgi:hypothetical protein
MTDGISDIAYGVLYIIYRQVVIYAVRAQKKYNSQSNRNFLTNHMFLGLQQVKNNCGLQDDNHARMNTQRAIDVLREMQTMTLKD